MSVLIIEGPEKSGKSTLCKAIAIHFEGLGGKVVIRHQTGRAVPDESMYYAQLLEDTSKPADKLIAIWDRAWVSEYVYGTLLNQNRPMVETPWVGEWLLGRMVQANGLRIILTGSSPKILTSRRDDSDLPVDPAEEQKLYIEYARRFGWTIYRPESSWANADGMAAMIINQFCRSIPPAHTALPPVYFGVADAETIIVSSRNQLIIGHELGDLAFKIGWVVAHYCPPPTLRYAKTLVATDAKAVLWLQNYVIEKGGKQRIIITDRSNVKHIISQLLKE